MKPANVVACALLWSAVIFAVAGCSEKPEAELPALGAANHDISVSGISSGAYMAGQFQMTNAKRVAGAAIIAGGPYGCSESVFADMIPGPGSAILNLTKAINGCMLSTLSVWGVGDPKLLANRARERAERGDIDPIADVITDRMYFFSGKNDHTVVPAVVGAAALFYKELGVPTDQMKLVSDMAAGHAFVTEKEGLACDITGEPYVVDCDYDQAGELLQQIYGPLKKPDASLSGKFVTFNQDGFTAGLGNSGLDRSGVVYVPQMCERRNDCKVHIAFHGCAQSKQKVGDAFIRESGFARWADSNGLIILFPQVAPSTFNPQGCWDWWGYTGNDYLTKRAPQIVAVGRMIDRLAEARPAL